MSGETVRDTLLFEDSRVAQTLLGEHEENLRTVAEQTKIKVSARGSQVFLEGDPHSVALARDALTQLYGLVAQGLPIYASDVEQAVKLLAQDRNVKLREIFLDTVFISNRKQVIAPKSLNQKLYINALREYDLVISIGPAGTGKTYLAMAQAVAALNRGEVDRIILTRPAVEAGERLGFLPGTMLDKINPYLRPLYDALHEMMSIEKVQRMIDRGTIEVAPLAFMRGRTLNDSFVILDEGQNTTSEQMKMFLTRLGFGSKAVVTGDITQIDLPNGTTSGLVQIQHVLAEVSGLKFVYLNETDVVRHRLVMDIVKAYDAYLRRLSVQQSPDQQEEESG
ncbi:MAG: PhoH family protein [Candidatus Alcyoniella australis]|nr:PhoH family protein [Candidatus Alcyoniella australis]